MQFTSEAGANDAVDLLHADSQEPCPVTCAFDLAEFEVDGIPNAKGAILDPTSDPDTFTLTKMGIDATKPTGRDFAERLTISDDQRVRARSLLEAAGVRL